MRMFALKHIGIGTLLLIPLAPLVVYLGFLFPYISGRNFFFRALTLIALACWLLLWIREPARYRPHPSFLVWAVLAFTTIVGIATVLAPHPSFAFWSTLERMDGLVSVLFIAMFFFSARALFDARRWTVFWNVSLGAALAVSFVALLQLASVLAIHQGGVRIDATLGNAAFFAAYMLLSAGLAFFLASGEAKRRRRLAYIACACLFLFLALASGTRSAFIALSIALFVSGSAAFLLRKDHINLKRFSVAMFAALALLAGLFFALRQIPSLSAHPLVGRLLSVSLTGADAQARFLSWNMVLKGTGERPLFGWGPEGFRGVFVKYYDPRLGGREPWFDRAHNEYLDWLVAAGILGLLAYLTLWYGLVRAVWRRESAFSAWKKVVLSGMFAGYAAFNIFSFDTITASILFFAFLAFVDSQSALRRARSEKKGELRQDFLKNWGGGAAIQFRLNGGESFSKSACRGPLITLLVLATLFIFYFTIAKPAYAAYLVHAGLRNNSPDLDTRLAYFTRAISLNTFATPEAREMLAQFAVDVSESPLNTASRVKIVSLVTNEFSRQIEKSPGDPRYPLRMGVVLNTYREYSKAVPFLEQAVALSPQKQPSLYELGTSYLNLGQFDTAVEIFKRAADALPDTEDAESKKLYAISLVYAHRFIEAEAYTKNIFGTTTFSDSRLFDAYRRTRQ